jgi:hypothetical protein
LNTASPFRGTLWRGDVFNRHVSFHEAPQHHQIGRQDMLRLTHGCPSIVDAAMLAVEAGHLQTNLRPYIRPAPVKRERGLNREQVINILRFGGSQQAAVIGILAVLWSIGTSRSAACILADWDTWINMIQPGFIETDMTAAMASNPLVKFMTIGTFSNTILVRRAGNA